MVSKMTELLERGCVSSECAIKTVLVLFLFIICYVGKIEVSLLSN